MIWKPIQSGQNAWSPSFRVLAACSTIADKLLQRWLMALAETPGSQIEILNRAERLGVIGDVEHWLEARKRRNKIIHKYTCRVRMPSPKTSCWGKSTP